MSNYIKELRGLVGHRPLLQIGASVIIEDNEGRILLQKRRDNGCWGTQGGSMELDESAEDAARRELFEETGLIAGKMELFEVFSGKGLHYTYPNGDEVSNVDVVFFCKDYSGELKAQKSELTELRFFKASEIPENISPPIKPVIDKWIQSKCCENKPKVIMTCGKVCSGKTTYANELCDKENAVILSVDELMIKLFGNDSGELHDEYVSRIKSFYLEKSIEILSCGTSVILDWGLWRYEERARLKAFYSDRGIKAEIHYIDIDDEEWNRRIDERNKKIADGKDDGYYIDDGLKKKFVSAFEAPQRDEVDVWINDRIY